MEDCRNIQDCSFVSIQQTHNREEKAGRASLCSTRLSDFSLHRSSLSTINGECFENSIINFQYNFKKTGSQWCDNTSMCKKDMNNLQTQLYEKNKKSRKQINQGLYVKEIDQLDDIEKKTQRLMMKEKQQRKQLKKLKKIYDETVTEYQQLKDKYEKQSQQIIGQMDFMKELQNKFNQQKSSLQSKISELNLSISAVVENLKLCESQRQLLCNKLQLFDANCQCRYRQPQKLKGQSDITERIEQILSYGDELASLRKEISIIDSKIQERSKSPTYHQLQQIVRLYQLRTYFNGSIQRLLVQQQSEKYQRIIEKLNKIILNNYRKLHTTSPYARETQIARCKEEVIQHSQKLQTDEESKTTDTFFTSSMVQSQYLEAKTALSQYLQTNRKISFTHQEYSSKWNSIKAQIENVINRSMISSYREIYQSMEDLAIGMIELCQLERSQSQFAAFVSGIMEQLNTHLKDKAQKHYQNISKLMQFIQNKDFQQRNTPELA